MAGAGFRGGSPVDDLFRAARAIREGAGKPVEVPVYPFLVDKPVDYASATKTEAPVRPLRARSDVPEQKTGKRIDLFVLTEVTGQTHTLVPKFKDPNGKTA